MEIGIALIHNDMKVRAIKAEEPAVTSRVEYFVCRHAIIQGNGVRIWSFLWICFFLSSLSYVHWQNYVLIVCKLVFLVSWTWLWGQKERCSFTSFGMFVSACHILHLLTAPGRLMGMFILQPCSVSHEDIPASYDLVSVLDSLSHPPHHWCWLISAAVVPW